jgi:hypothetical protein
MQPTDPTPPEPEAFEQPKTSDSDPNRIDAGKAEEPTADDPLLARVREVARRITKRVRKTMTDTDLEQPALPDAPTDEAPPLAGSEE